MLCMEHERLCSWNLKGIKEHKRPCSYGTGSWIYNFLKIMQSVPIATKVVGFNPTHDKGFVGKCYILDFHSPKCLEITTVLLTDFSLSLTK